MAVSDVLNGEDRCFFTSSDATAFMNSLPAKSVDLVIGSPPYPKKGERYGEVNGIPRCDIEGWIDFMFEVTQASLRVCHGDVFWVVNNAMHKRAYHPAVEGLVWKCYQAGITLDRPAIWQKNALHSRDDYLENSWEYILAFRGYPGPRQYFDWERIGTEKKYSNGGDFNQRDSKGVRRKGGTYPKGKLARPRDVIYVTVGGGHMGSKLAHENEAPYPEKLVERFIPVFCPPDGIVADPFLGSGTTAKVAMAHGRRFVGCDLRECQVDLTQRRIAELKEN